MSKHSKLSQAMPLLLLLLFTGFGIWLSTLLSPQQLRALLERFGSLAPLCYIGLFAVLPAFFFPVAVLALAGGLLFGLWWGSVYTFVGAMLNCGLMFLLARRLGREQVSRLAQRRLSPQWQQRLARAGGRQGFVLLVVLRLIPAVPYNLINYTFGLTGMSLGAYLLGSAVGIIPGTLAFINIGDKAMEAGSPSFWLAIGLMALLLAVTGLLGRRLYPPPTRIPHLQAIQTKRKDKKAMKQSNLTQTNKRSLPRWGVLLAAAAAVILYLTLPPVQEFVGQAVRVLGSADVEAVADYIRSFGVYAVVFSFLLMVLQSVAAPLPAFLITFANAALFGWWQGAILSWTSAMAGAMLCFGIARALGRDVVERFAGKGALAGVEGYFQRYGSRTILVCRLLPFVSFDAVSYFAGLTPIRFWPFVLATGLGQLPATIVYSYVGGMLTGGVKYFVTALLCIFSLGILGSIARRIYQERHNRPAGLGDE